MSELEDYDACTTQAAGTKDTQRMQTQIHFQQPLTEGAAIRHRVLTELASSGIEVTEACRLTGCRESAMAGDADLLFVEVVAIGLLMGCAPAVFFVP